MDAHIYFDSINTIFYALFGFILALFSAWSWQLLPHEVVYLFDTDRRAQLVALFLLFTFTLQYFNSEHNITQLLLHAVIMFFVYLLITKQSLFNFILTMVGFVLSALFTNNIKFLNKKLESDKADKDETKNEKDNKMINVKIEQNTRLRNGSIIFTLVTTFVGVGLYFMKQYKDHYKKDQNISIFMLKFLFEGGSRQRKTIGNVISR